MAWFEFIFLRLLENRYVTIQQGCKSITVTMGHSDWSSHQTITKSVTSKLIHPNYNNSGENDIALLKLSEDIIFNKVIQPIALPSSSDYNYIEEYWQGDRS